MSWLDDPNDDEDSAGEGGGNAPATCCFASSARSKGSVVALILILDAGVIGDTAGRRSGEWIGPGEG